MFRKKTWLPILLILFVFSGLILYGDFNEVIHQIRNFPLKYFMAALALTYFNYLLRFLRWEYYLRTLNISIPTKQSMLIFTSGLGMALTPWKIGEVLKGYYLQERHQIPISTTAPIIFMERVTDVLAVICLGFLGIKWLPQSAQILLCCAVSFLTVGWYFASKHRDAIVAIPGLRRWEHQLNIAEQASHGLNTPKTLLVATIISLLAWTSEGTALWIILLGIDSQINLSTGVVVYSVATLGGALTALPGGLIGTEGTMVALLQDLGVEKAMATTSTILVRVATLWFALLIGLIAIICLSGNKKPHIFR